MLKLTTKKKTHIVEFREYEESTQDHTGEVLALFHVQQPSPSETKKFLDTNMDRRWLSPDKKTKKELHENPNWLKITYDRIDTIIVGWEEVVLTDENDEVIDDNPKCNRENKIKIFENNPDVINYVLEKADEIFDLERKVKEDQEKNLESGPSGSPVDLPGE